MIKGSLVPNITFFDQKGKLDLEKTKWHMRWMFEKGVDGLFLTGSYGSGPMISVDERVEIFKAAKEIASEFKGKSLIPHVGCIDTESTIKLAQAAEKIGVDAIGAVPPFYYKNTEDWVIGFYKDLIESVKTPVFAYNNPETSRFTFTLKTVQKLQTLGLKGMKDSPLDVSFVSRVFYDAKINKKDFQLILGTSNGWLPYYYMGVQAAIAGINNWAPEIMTELVSATFEGDIERSEKAYAVMMDLSANMHFSDSTVVSHMGLYARGYDAGFPLKPKALYGFEDSKYEEMKKWLQGGFDELGLRLEIA
jgi:dihydrodipicolinate synthase/N-acetylneuraminate lyase